MSALRNLRLPRPEVGNSSLLFYSAALVIAVPSLFAAPQAASQAAPVAFRQYCVGCHGNALASGAMNLEKLLSRPVEDNFLQWRKIAVALEQNRMPPEKARQPSQDDRRAAAAWIRTGLADYAAKHAGDPGKVTVRRLTSAEYAYSIRDLTGLDFKLDGDFGTDSVGGEGFTNFGDVQFMADANLERYLEAAKKVADHAVTGAGPLIFFDDPGKTGFELSAISRINQIYRTYGFRANSGEGGKPYGMEKYTNVFYACWRYQHRAALGEPQATLEQVATREGSSPRFARHIWTVLHASAPTYPTSTVVAKFNAMPAPGSNREQSASAGRKAADEVMRAVVDWPRWLLAAGAVAEGGEGDERALVINDAALQVSLSHPYRFPLRTRGKQKPRIYFSVMAANAESKNKPAVLWHAPMIRVRGKDRALGEPQPLKSLVDPQTVARLKFGQGANGEAIDPNDFVATEPVFAEVIIPEGSYGADMQVEAKVAGDPGDGVIRCVVSDAEEVSKGRPVWALLGDPKNSGYLAWKKNVLDFSARLPQNSQGEAAPSDKDPIPLPYDNTYNKPERDQFHARVKYYRTDQFLWQNILDDATRRRLDIAWNDLLASFEYHNINLRFVAAKYHLDLKNKGIADLDAAAIESLPAEPRQYVKALRESYDAVMRAQLSGRPGHLDDCIQFAAKAWRRPLTGAEKDRLRAFYVELTERAKLDHGRAIEVLLARILVSPSFLYRMEAQPALARSGAPRAELAKAEQAIRPLAGFEVASRLSYFLWSSVPDAELERAAAAGELADPTQVRKQVSRMLADPKARRFATEFFGQWLGFYRFDQYRGVDAKRFPEFTDEVKSAMYDEAVSFFEHIVRNGRPAREILSADYTFLNRPLAKHYGIKAEVKSAGPVEMVTGASAFQRGGLLRLGAVLTATSAPLRTSPVKRGDWVLRRVLGTPTPPPPANAGSIPADDKLFGGMSVKERLASHQRNATCAACHSRIDPLGFPFERYDSVGRIRAAYADGKAIDDSSKLSDRADIAGIDGLLGYLKSEEPQVLRNMAQKLIGYAFGRTVLASDEPLIEQLTKAGGDAPFSDLVAQVASSKQFLYRREGAAPDAAAPVRKSSLTAPSKTSNKEGGL